MTEPLQGPFMLIVDDDEEARAPLEITLHSLPGYFVYSCGDGAEALAILAANVTGVCAIVTDVQLPKVDGFELVRQVRADSRWNSVPIVVVSADPYAETPLRLRRLGANAFFSKPYSPAEIRTALERLLYAKDETCRSVPADTGSDSPGTKTA